MPYKILADERTYVTRSPDDDGWDQGDSALDLTVRSVHRNDPSGSRWGWHTPDDYIGIESDDDIPVGSVAYVVYAKYTTGSTFGSDEAWCVICVKATAEAAQAAKADLEAREDDFRLPWIGYFESLNYIEIDALVMQP